MTKNSEERFYSTAQAAKVAGVSVRTILRWWAQGKVTGFKTRGKHRRVSADSLRRMKPYKRRQ